MLVLLYKIVDAANGTLCFVVKTKLNKNFTIFLLWFWMAIRVLYFLLNHFFVTVCWNIKGRCYAFQTILCSQRPTTLQRIGLHQHSHQRSRNLPCWALENPLRWIPEVSPVNKQDWKLQSIRASKNWTIWQNGQKWTK